MKVYTKKLAFCAFLMFSGLMFLPGCFWSKKSSNQSTGASTSNNDVLMTIDGKPALTVAQYEEQLKMARDANPQIEMFLQMVPNAEQSVIFRGIATARLVEAWADQQGILSSTEFTSQLKNLQDAMKLQLCMKFFDEAHPVEVSDSDVQQYYHEKKDSIPGLAITQGGVDTMYVRFDTKNKAQSFFESVKDLKKEEAFKKAAEDAKHVAGKSTINATSPFGEAIKKVVLDLKKFPTVQIVKVSDDAYWVIFASGKTEAKYHDLKSPQVQQGLRKMITDERKEKQLETVLEKLKKEMNVVENSKYFEDKEAAKRAAQASQVGNAQEEDEKSLDVLKA